MTQPWTDEDARILRAKHYADLRAPAEYDRLAALLTGEVEEEVAK